MAINYNEEEFGLQLPNNNQGIMEVADLYDTPDGALPYWGPGQYNYNEGMLNTPSTPETLNFPADTAMAISNYEELFGPKKMTDANQSLYTGMMDQSGFPVNYIDRIRQQNLPGFAYEPKESLINRIGSQLGNVKNTVGDVLGDAWGKTKEIGTQFKEGAAPVFGLASMIGNAVNPINPKAFNYNPELAGQLNFIDQQFPGMMVNNPTSGLLQYAQGTPLAGQNVMSIAGSNDPIAQLEKQIARHQKTIDKLPDMWGNLKETDIDAYNKKLNIHKTRLKNAKTLRDTILANKKSRIAERIKNERAAGAAANQATQRRAGRGGDHMSRSRSQGGLGISRAQAQAVSDANRAAGMGGWGLARGGRVGYANGGLASLFTRRG